MPSESSFFRALRIVTATQLQAALDPWLDEKLGPASHRELVAIDGKTLNHSGVHLVSAILVPSLRCLGVEAVADKTNEITALRQLVDRIELDGRLVEMDALHTQDETVEKLLYEKGADYIVTIKANQPTVLTTAQTLLPEGLPPSGGHVGRQSQAGGAPGDHHPANHPGAVGLGGSPTSGPRATHPCEPGLVLCR